MPFARRYLRRSLVFGIPPSLAMEPNMTTMKPKFVSLRAVFFLFGLTLASCLALPAAAVLTATEAEARVGNPASAVSVAGVEPARSTSGPALQEGTGDQADDGA